MEEQHVNELCPKHDKIFSKDNPCPGCEEEKRQLKLTGPDDELAEQRGVLPEEETQRRSRRK